MLSETEVTREMRSIAKATLRKARDTLKTFRRMVNRRRDARTAVDSVIQRRYDDAVSTLRALADLAQGIHMQRMYRILDAHAERLCKSFRPLFDQECTDVLRNLYGKHSTARAV